MVSMAAAGLSLLASASSAAKPVPAGMKTRPGLVQNWPAPIVNEAASPAASWLDRWASAAAVMTTGFRLPSSP